MNSKGSRCSVSGRDYEKKVHQIVKNCKLNGTQFNTQEDKDLGGSSSKNDIECNYLAPNIILGSIQLVGIEVKKRGTPDWMQCSIKLVNNRWIGSEKGKIPIKSREIFNKLIKDLKLFDGATPPFLNNPITHEEWICIKRETPRYNDIYFDVPRDTIRKLYSEKGCYYIQISDGHGLYHLGNDICGFNVPLFEPDQKIRIRIKVHTKKNAKGFAGLSITIACLPKNIRSLPSSSFSLDEKDKIPSNMVYHRGEVT